MLAGGTALAGTLKTTTAFPGSLSRGGQGSAAFPVAKVALLAVALEGRWAATLTTLAASIRAGGIEATAVAATVRGAARARQLGKRALAGPVGDLTSLDAVLGWGKSVGGAVERRSKGRRTRLGDANADVAALELGTREVEGLLQAFDGAKLDVAEALGLAVKLVLDNAHVGDLAAAEEVVDVTLGGVEGQVAQMGSVWRLVGKGELLAHGVAAVGCGG